MKEEKQEKLKITKKFIGEVVSDKMAKTIVVKVERIKMHPKYKKRFKVTKKYKVHDEKKQAKVGNVVEFIECRPISKSKKWRLIKVVK